MTDATWRADPLTWGHGPHEFEMFIEPTCPHSFRAFGKMDALLAHVGENRLSVKLRLQSQPWHMFSGVICRAIIAASTLPEGKEAARAILQAVGEHREEFEFDHHAGGANMDATPNDILARIRDYSGVNVTVPFAIPDLDREVKWHARYSRQNGIHVSPTFMVDGIVHADLGSRDEIEKWAGKIPS